MSVAYGVEYYVRTILLPKTVEHMKGADRRCGILELGCESILVVWVE